MSTTAEQRAARAEAIRKQREAAGVASSGGSSSSDDAAAAAADAQGHAEARAAGKSAWDSFANFFAHPLDTISSWFSSGTSAAGDAAEGAKDGIAGLWEKLKKLLGDVAGDWKSLLGGVGGLFGGWMIGNMFGDGLIGKLIGGLLAVGGFFMGRDLMNTMFGNGEAPGARSGDGQTRERSVPSQNVELVQSLDALGDRAEALHRAGEKLIRAGQLAPAERAKLDRMKEQTQAEINRMETAAGGQLSPQDKQAMETRISSMNTQMDGWLTDQRMRDAYLEEFAAVKREGAQRTVASSSASTSGASEREARRAARAEAVIDTPQELHAELVAATQKAQVAQQIVARQAQTGELTDKQAQRQMQSIMQANQVFGRVGNLMNGLNGEQITIAAREVQQAERGLERISSRDPLTMLEVQQRTVPQVTPGFASAPTTVSLATVIDPNQVRSPQTVSQTAQYTPAPVGGQVIDPVAVGAAGPYRG